MGLRSGEYGGKKIIFLFEEEIKVERRDLLRKEALSKTITELSGIEGNK